ncbi:DUF1289 domain-containing protein [Ramlibacter sp. AN1015]|uniref:DUF1289 domain-containing protein n=1 Tax=Ramlibacter sp. AN1015 TaxID=3133428 RepID=UPI0030C00480
MLARAQAVAAAGAGSEDVPSPCSSVCRMDPASGWCAGCLRTLDEIASWGGMDAAAKRRVWHTIGARARHLEDAEDAA